MGRRNETETGRQQASAPAEGAASCRFSRTLPCLPKAGEQPWKGKKGSRAKPAHFLRTEKKEVELHSPGALGVLVRAPASWILALEMGLWHWEHWGHYHWLNNAIWQGRSQHGSGVWEECGLEGATHPLAETKISPFLGCFLWTKQGHTPK